MAFSDIIFFPNLVNAYYLFKIWKLGHTHTHTHIMAVMWKERKLRVYGVEENIWT